MSTSRRFNPLNQSDPPKRRSLPQQSCRVEFSTGHLHDLFDPDNLASRYGSKRDRKVQPKHRYSRSTGSGRNAR